MDITRIAELLEPFLGPVAGKRLADTDLAKISAYIDLLVRWNARVNLTAIRDPEEIVTRHFGESFFAARHLFPDPADNLSSAPKAAASPLGLDRIHLADVGSGAGFPGLPVKLWAPEVSLTLIEANHKKAVFLREVCRHLKLNDLKIENARAETIPPGTFDVVTLRAVERFSDALAVAASLVRESGSVALLISSAQLQTAKSALTDCSWGSPYPVPMSESRLLLVGTRNQTHQ
jgi:16S rRNA (guanine527-N7)-methyltransferase